LLILRWEAIEFIYMYIIV